MAARKHLGKINTIKVYKMKPLKTISGWSWLGIVNFVFFQWFCIRLAYTIVPSGPDGSEQERLWMFSGPYLPLTGWDLPLLKGGYVKLRHKK